jgi:hypothetical protein
MRHNIDFDGIKMERKKIRSFFFFFFFKFFFSFLVMVILVKCRLYKIRNMLNEQQIVQLKEP